MAEDRHSERRSVWPCGAKNLVTVLFLLAPSLAFAQSPDPKEKYRRGPNTRHLGPLYITPKILASAGWDTNVTNSESDPFRDSTFGMSAVTEVFWPIGRRLRVIGTGSIAPNYFGRTESARSFDRGGTLGAGIDLGRLTLGGVVGASRAKQRFSIEVDDRLWRYEHSKSASAAIRLTRRLSLSGGWEKTGFDYEKNVLVGDDEVAQSLNRDRTTTSFAFGYALTKRTSLKGQAELMDDVFLGTATDPADETVRSYRYLGGITFSPIAKIQGEALAGWRHFPGGRSDSAPAYDGLTLEVRLQIPVGSGLALAALRDVYYAVGQTRTALGTRRNSFVSSRYSATMGFDMPLQLIARGTVQFWRADYILPYEVDGATLDRADDVWTFGGSLLRRLGPRVALGGTVEHSTRATNAPGLRYGGTRYGVTAEVYP